MESAGWVRPQVPRRASRPPRPAPPRLLVGRGPGISGQVQERMSLFYGLSGQRRSMVLPKFCQQRADAIHLDVVDTCRHRESGAGRRTQNRRLGQRMLWCFLAPIRRDRRECSVPRQFQRSCMQTRHSSNGTPLRRPKIQPLSRIPGKASLDSCPTPVVLRGWGQDMEQCVYEFILKKIRANVFTCRLPMDIFL